MTFFKIKYKLTSLFCLFVLILSVMPSRNFPKVEVTCIDKIVHFLLYFSLVGAMFFDNIFCKNTTFQLKKLLFFLLFSIIFGAIIEIIQYFLPSRSAEWFDLLSNSLGAMFGVIVIFIVKRLILQKKSNL